MGEKRVTQQVASDEIYNDDWFLKDSVLHDTTKVQPSVIKEYVNQGMATSQNLADEATARQQADTQLASGIGKQMSNLADFYDTTTSYVVGDVVMQQSGDLLRCIAPTSGAFDNTKWESVTVDELFDDLNFNADAISYDNTSSGLEAENVQDAIDETITKLSAVGTASGDIATFTDGSDLSMPKLEVAIEPVQDLHGYDAPWVGGAGKNKCPINESTITGATYIVDTDINIASGTWTFSFKSAVTTNCSLQITDADGNTLASVGINNPSRSATVTINAVGKHLKFYGYAGTYKNIQLENGSTATTYAPYSNICPISGWSEANVVDDSVYGGNINWNQLTQNGDFADTSVWQPLNMIVSVTDHVMKLTRENAGISSIYQVVDAPVNHKYFWTLEVKGDNTYSDWVMSFGSAEPYLLPITTSWVKQESIISKTSTSTNFNAIRKNQGSIGDVVYLKNVMLIDLTRLFGSTIADYIYSLEQAEAGSGVAYFKSLFYKDYYAYNSGEITNVSAVNGDTDKYRTTTIPFTDSQGNPITVYGGSLDVVSGVLTVDRVSVIYDGSENNWVWTDSYKQASINLPQNAKYSVTEISWKCNNLTPVANTSRPENVGNFSSLISSGGASAFSAPNCNTLEEFKTWASNNNIQFCYELATPLTIQLSPTVVKSLRGKNNVFADSGAILDAEYIRDMTTIINYILEQLNA